MVEQQDAWLKGAHTTQLVSLSCKCGSREQWTHCYISPLANSLAHIVMSLQCGVGEAVLPHAHHRLDHIGLNIGT